MKKNFKSFYDKRLAPLASYIFSLCNEEGVPMFLTFQIGPSSFANTSVNLEKSQWDKQRLLSMISETWSLDEFMLRVIKDAEESGHDSQVLDALGIPRRPEGQVYSSNDKSRFMKVNSKVIYDDKS